MKNLYLYIPLLILFISTNISIDRIVQDNKGLKKQNDSIFIWIEYSKDRSLDYQKRKLYLDKAYAHSLKEANDSLRSVYLTKISFTYYFKLGDSLNFREVNKQAINLSIKIKDSQNLANNYWDIAGFYSKKGLKDSAYFSFAKAQKIFELQHDDFHTGRMLVNMAIIQSDLKDYTGSEITTFEAIELLIPLNKYKQLYRCYNNLGIVLNELKEYDKAIFYHNEALEYNKKIKGKNTNKENSLNNLGVVYSYKNEFKKSINYYQQALKEKKLKVNNPKLYAMLLDNLAYSKFKTGDYTNSKVLFFEALKIRDSINDFSGIAMSKLRLSQYFSVMNDTVKAMQYAGEVMQLTADKKNYRDLLSAQLLLSKLDKKNNYVYARQYIKLHDSLQQQERAIRNKFTRIRFETDEFIIQNKRLIRQNEFILIISALTVLLGLLLFIIRSQRTKNKELEFDQQQQQYNNEIFDLMLVQQYKIEEGRRIEKQRISEELHDGVLGKLLGARLILGTLNSQTDEESVVKREKCINELQSIEEEVRNVSHELHEKSLVLEIGYIKMINNLLKNQSEVSNFACEFNYDKSIIWKEIKGSLKMNLYRIIQEAIQNINKYAKAKNVIVEFKVDDDYLYLLINDDGIGFKSKSKSKGIGLKNIKSRTAKLKGQLTIKTKPNEGTSILVKVPYK